MATPQKANATQALTNCVAPTLFIGIGGTGSEIVGRVKNRVDQLSADMQRPDLQFVSYLALDSVPMIRQTATVKACFQEDKTGKAGASFRYLGGFNEFEYLRGQLQQRTSRDPDLARWWDQRLELPDELIDNGAGRIRSVGRLCLYRHYTEVVQLMQSKLSGLYSLRDQQRAKISPDLATMAPNIVIVGGSAGGTGSGMFLDVSYMSYHLARAIFHVPPKITAVITLPGLYSKRGAGLNQDLSDAFQANAAALFQEIEYFLQDPLKMDQRRLDYVQPAFEITQGAWVPFHNCYLVSETLSGGSIFEELVDLYAYVARALFQLYLIPENVYDSTAKVNLHKIKHKPIPGVGYAPAYSAFGFASIEHPTQIMLGYLGAKYALTLLNNGLGSPEKAKEDVIRRETSSKAKVWLNELGKKTYTPFLSRLDDIKASALKKLPTSILTGDGRVPPADRLPAQLLSARTAADQVVTGGIKALNEAYESAEAGVLEEVQQLINATIDTPSDGFFAVSVLLGAADDQLTQIVAQLRTQQVELRTLSGKARTILDADAAMPGSQASVIARPSLASARDFIRELLNYASNAIAEEALRLRIRILDQVCGPPTSVTGPQLNLLNMETGGEAALLDRARVQVSAILGILNTEAVEYQNRLENKRFELELGNARVTTFMPELDPDNAESWAELDRQFAGRFRDAKVIAGEMQELVRFWIETPGMIRPHQAENKDELLAMFRKALRSRATALFSDFLATPIDGLLAKCTDREQRLAMLLQHATLCCMVKTENLPREYGTPGPLWSLGSPCDLSQDLGLADLPLGKANLGPRQISLMHSEHGFPVISVPQMLAPYALYRRGLKPPPASRDNLPRFFLHNWSDWNRPEGVPLQGGTTSILKVIDPMLIELFSFGRAINAGAKDSKVKEKLQEIVYVDPVLEELGELPTGELLGGYIFQRRDGGRNAITQYYFQRYRAFESKGNRIFQPCEEVLLGADLIEALTRFAEILDAIDRQTLNDLIEAVYQVLGEEDYAALCLTYRQKLKERRAEVDGDERDALTEMYRALMPKQTDPSPMEEEEELV